MTTALSTKPIIDRRKESLSRKIKRGYERALLVPLYICTAIKKSSRQAYPTHEASWVPPFFAIFSFLISHLIELEKLLIS